LRVFIRAGVMTHGPDQHDHPLFLKEWTKLLNDRGVKAEGALDFPTAEAMLGLRTARAYQLWNACWKHPANTLN